MGSWKETNDNVDFYLRANDDDTMALWFAAPTDRLPGESYGYEHVGFYDDATLSTRISTTTVAGTADTAHEKLPIAIGTRIVYVESRSGLTYRLTVIYEGGPSAIIRAAARAN